MKRLVIVLILVMMASSAEAADKWTTGNYALEGVYLGALAIDWMQTRNIARHPDRFKEYNPILGSHPHSDKVDLICLGSALGHVLVTHMLPEEYRPYWQWSTAALEVSAVGWNFNAGIAAKW